jgi:hypothetical protein
MSTYYQCICGYSTKNEEYKNFHQQHTQCVLVEKESDFEGKSGIIYKATSKCGKNLAFFGKFFESEKKLRDQMPNHELDVKMVVNCDIEYIKLLAKARQLGLISGTQTQTPIIRQVRHASADQLFKMSAFESQ